MNSTLTPRSVTLTPSGWWSVVDSENQSWSIPPEDRDTKVSNAELAKEIEASVGKPIELTTWIKPDGSTRMIFGKPKAAGGGKRPYTPSYRDTREGQEASSRSIEAQVAAKIASEMAIAQFEPKLKSTRIMEDGLVWMEQAVPRIFAAIQACKGSGGGGGVVLTGKRDDALPPSEQYVGAGGSEALGQALQPETLRSAPAPTPSSEGESNLAAGAPLSGFILPGGPYAGWAAWEVAQKDPAYLRGVLAGRLTDSDRAAVETALAGVEGEWSA